MLEVVEARVADNANTPKIANTNTRRANIYTEREKERKRKRKRKRKRVSEREREITRQMEVVDTKEDDERREM